MSQWKRIAIEAPVIVGSILLAFSIDAWWQEHSDQIRVEAYLEQVRADTQDNLRRLREALQLEKKQLDAAQKILFALRSSEPMTLESAREWTRIEPGFMWYSDPRLLDGALTALVTTGDINSVRDMVVKTSIVNYLGQLQADMNEFDRGVGRFLIIHDELLRVFEPGRLPGANSGDDALANELLAAQNDKTTATIFRLLEKNIGSRTWYLEQMLAATEKLSDELTTQSNR